MISEEKIAAARAALGPTVKGLPWSVVIERQHNALQALLSSDEERPDAQG